MRNFLHRNREILAFVILALITMLALHAVVTQGDKNLRNAQQAICQRANAVVNESNTRIASHKADTHVLEQFLLSARKARHASYKIDHRASDLKAEKEYTALARDLREKVRFHPIPPINCQELPS